MKVLVTGFKPFLGSETNPSELLATKISKEFNNVESIILPVEFGKSFSLLNQYVKMDSFDKIIMLGQAAGRKKICLEKIALNWVQTEYPDESGYLPQTGEISKASPLALMTKFPIEDIYEKLKKENYEVEISFSAGTFVCNELYFRALQSYNNILSVFVHVPLAKDLEFEKQYKTIQQLVKLLFSD